MWQVAQCRGIEMLWVMLSQVCVDDSLSRFEPLRLLIYRVQEFSESATSLPALPEPPEP
jgi:hypothetical protein